MSAFGAVTLVEWSYDKPLWRGVEHGLCLEGECRNTACVAYSEMVIMSQDFGNFDLVLDSGRTRCPQCFKRVIPSTCAFNNCMWAFDGKKTGEVRA